MIHFKYYLIWLTALFLFQCDANPSDQGFFSSTEEIQVYSNSAASIQWETSFRDNEVIVVITDQTLSLVNNSIDSTSFTTGNTRYWRFSFGTGSNGNINPATDLSNDISTYTFAAVGGIGSPRYWVVYSYGKNGNLIRSSAVYSFP